MKPLFFPVVLLSPLDAAIWLKVDARMDGEREYALHVEARKADRRDAELMLKLVQARIGWRALFKCFGPRVNPEGFDQVGEGPDAVPMPRLRL